MKKEFLDLFDRCLDRMNEKLDRVFDYSEKYHYNVEMENNKTVLNFYSGANGTKQNISQDEIEKKTGIAFDKLSLALAISQVIAHDNVTRGNSIARKNNLQEKIPIVLLTTAIISKQLSIHHQRGDSNKNINVNDISSKIFEILYEYNDEQRKATGKNPLRINTETEKFIKQVLNDEAFPVVLNNELKKNGLEIAGFQKLGDRKNKNIHISVQPKQAKLKPRKV